MSLKKHVTEEGEILTFREFRPYSQEVIDDPLEELLNEFSELEDEMEENYEQIQEGIYSFVDILQKIDQRDVVNMVDEQLDVLQESTKRIKFYLDEIESFIPRK